MGFPQPAEMRERRKGMETKRTLREHCTAKEVSANKRVTRVQYKYVTIVHSFTNCDERRRCSNVKRNTNNVFKLRAYLRLNSEHWIESMETNTEDRKSVRVYDFTMILLIASIRFIPRTSWLCLYPFSVQRRNDREDNGNIARQKVITRIRRF